MITTLHTGKKKKKINKNKIKKWQRTARTFTIARGSPRQTKTHAEHSRGTDGHEHPIGRREGMVGGVYKIKSGVTNKSRVNTYNTIVHTLQTNATRCMTRCGLT